MKTLKAFANGDGAHCGLTDWYEDKEKALKRAIKSGRPFDTGWYGSKKEIASARICYEGTGNCVVEVSVSDDFDTEGTGTDESQLNLESIREAIYRAWDKANENSKDNAQYAGYSLYKWKGETSKCLDYYIVSTGECDYPPGDNYHHWGWQDDPDCDNGDAGNTCNPTLRVPAKTVERFVDFAQSLKRGSLRIGAWEIRAWEDGK